MLKLLLVMSLFTFLGCGHKRPVLGPELDKNVHVQSLYFSATHGYHAYSNIGYKAERLENESARVTVEVGNDRDRVFVAEASVLDSLEAIVREYKMDRYRERYMPMFDIKDGDTWDFSLKYSDGKRVRSGGYEALPTGGREAFNKVEAFFSPWLNREPSADAVLTAFRFELHSDEGTEVFWFRKEKEHNAVYFRELGSFNGWNYYCGAPQVLQQLSDDMRSIHAPSYCGEKLSEEDTARPRWIAVLEYEDGQLFELMDYLDREGGYDHCPPTNTEREIRYSAEQRFSAELARIEALPDEARGEHSRTTYHADGTPSRIIRYAGDGTVLGGYDYDNPMNDF